MASLHYEVCSAPICVEDPTLGWKSCVKWFPGEDICSKGRSQMQINQRKINKLVSKGKFKFLDAMFTGDILSKITRVSAGTGGRISSKSAYKHRKSPYVDHFVGNRS